MFKIEDVYVEDKQLAQFLRAVAGIVRGVPRPVPVMNVTADLTSLTNGANMVAVFADYVIKSKIQTFTPKDVQAWLVKNGRSKLSSNYILKNLVKTGMVKRSGKSAKSTYTVQAKS